MSLCRSRKKKPESKKCLIYQIDTNIGSVTGQGVQMTNSRYQVADKRYLSTRRDFINSWSSDRLDSLYSKAARLGP